MSTFWLLIDPFRPLLVLFALLGPFLGLGLALVVAYRRRNRGHAGATALSGVQTFGLGLAAAPIVLWFATCTPPPGEGRLAHDGKQRGMILVAALDDFRQRTGQYPDSLRQLMPSLSDADLIAHPTASRQSYSWEYRRDSIFAFQLGFHYVGPGMNHCSITAVKRTWECSGYF